jgi:hypothetical protein
MASCKISAGAKKDSKVIVRGIRMNLRPQRASSTKNWGDRKVVERPWVSAAGLEIQELCNVK